MDRPRDAMEDVRGAGGKVAFDPRVHAHELGRAGAAFEAAAAKKVIDRLTTALHDAINSPKGVVPDSAAEFYDPERVSDE